MIAETVRLPGYNNENISEMLDWLRQHIGPDAPFADCVDLDRAWYMNTMLWTLEVSFARSEDATMFRLRWL